MMDLSFWGSVIGGIISGILTLSAAVITIKYYQQKDYADRKEREEKEKREIAEREKKEKEIIMLRRPQLEIVDIKQNPKEDENEKYDLDVYYDYMEKPKIINERIFAQFYDDILEKNKFFSIIITLKTLEKQILIKFP